MGDTKNTFSDRAILALAAPKIADLLREVSRKSIAETRRKKLKDLCSTLTSIFRNVPPDEPISQTATPLFVVPLLAAIKVVPVPPQRAETGETTLLASVAESAFAAAAPSYGTMSAGTLLLAKTNCIAPKTSAKTLQKARIADFDNENLSTNGPSGNDSAEKSSLSDQEKLCISEVILEIIQNKRVKPSEICPIANHAAGALPYLLMELEAAILSGRQAAAAVATLLRLLRHLLPYFYLEFFLACAKQKVRNGSDGLPDMEGDKRSGSLEKSFETVITFDVLKARPNDADEIAKSAAFILLICSTVIPLCLRSETKHSRSNTVLSSTDSSEQEENAAPQATNKLLDRGRRGSAEVLTTDWIYQHDVVMNELLWLHSDIVLFACDPYVASSASICKFENVSGFEAAALGGRRLMELILPGSLTRLSLLLYGNASKALFRSPKAFTRVFTAVTRSVRTVLDDRHLHSEDLQLIASCPIGNNELTDAIPRQTDRQQAVQRLTLVAKTALEKFTESSLVPSRSKDGSLRSVEMPHDIISIFVEFCSLLERATAVILTDSPLPPSRAGTKTRSEDDASVPPSQKTVPNDPDEGNPTTTFEVGQRNNIDTLPHLLLKGVVLSAFMAAQSGPLMTIILRQAGTTIRCSKAAVMSAFWELVEAYGVTLREELTAAICLNSAVKIARLAGIAFGSMSIIRMFDTNSLGANWSLRMANNLMELFALDYRAVRAELVRNGLSYVERFLQDGRELPQVSEAFVQFNLLNDEGEASIPSFLKPDMDPQFRSENPREILNITKSTQVSILDDMNAAEAEVAQFLGRALFVALGGPETISVLTTIPSLLCRTERRDIIHFLNGFLQATCILRTEHCLEAHDNHLDSSEILDISDGNEMTIPKAERILGNFFFISLVLQQYAKALHSLDSEDASHYWFSEGSHLQNLWTTLRLPVSEGGFYLSPGELLPLKEGREDLQNFAQTNFEEKNFISSVSRVDLIALSTLWRIVILSALSNVLHCMNVLFITYESDTEYSSFASTGEARTGAAAVPIRLSSEDWWHFQQLVGDARQVGFEVLELGASSITLLSTAAVRLLREISSLARHFDRFDQRFVNNNKSEEIQYSTHKTAASSNEGCIEWVSADGFSMLNSFYIETIEDELRFAVESRVNASLESDRQLDESFGRSLLTCVAFCSIESLCRFRPIVAQLAELLIPQPTAVSFSNPPTWPLKVWVALSNRLSYLSMSFKVSASRKPLRKRTRTGKLTEEPESSGSDSSAAAEYMPKKSTPMTLDDRRLAAIAEKVIGSVSAASVQHNFTSRRALRAPFEPHGEITGGAAADFNAMAMEMLLISRAMLTSSDMQISLQAHLVVLRSLSYFVKKPKTARPLIHKIWEPLVDSLRSGQLPPGTLATALCTTGICVAVDAHFVTSRILHDVFPLLLGLLGTNVPVGESEEKARTVLFKSQDASLSLLRLMLLRIVGLENQIENVAVTVLPYISARAAPTLRRLAEATLNIAHHLDGPSVKLVSCILLKASIYATGVNVATDTTSRTDFKESLITEIETTAPRPVHTALTERRGDNDKAENCDVTTNSKEAEDRIEQYLGYQLTCIDVIELLRFDSCAAASTIIDALESTFSPSKAHLSIERPAVLKPWLDFLTNDFRSYDSLLMRLVSEP